jgi:hypothetical protein
VTGTLLTALLGEKIVHSSSVATVTTNCIVVKAFLGRHTYVLSLCRLGRIKKVTTTYPGLLVISLGLEVVSAGDYCSPHCEKAYAVLGVVGLAFLAAYFWTRRASLLFLCESEPILTAQGRLREVAALISALQRTRLTDEHFPDSLAALSAGVDAHRETQSPHALGETGDGEAPQLTTW